VEWLEYLQPPGIRRMAPCALRDGAFRHDAEARAECGKVDKDEQRFFCKREPSGQWAVWDSIQDTPATLGGGPLSGREETRARSACDILNAIYRRQLDADSMRERNGVGARSGSASDGARGGRPPAERAQEHARGQAAGQRETSGSDDRGRLGFRDMQTARRDCA
jgi:hypothetical protein